MNILIADNHELVRCGVSKIISEEFSFAKILEVSNGIQAEKTSRNGQWDLIIMDMAMPHKTGFEVLKQLRAEANKTPILILSIHPENQYALRILKAGGNGYLTKNCLRQDFVSAVKVILKGKKYISDEVSEKLALSFNDDLYTELYELLSDRELQILKLIGMGKTVSEIADELTLSVATISTYRSRLLTKLDLKNNAELTHYAINNQLV